MTQAFSQQEKEGMEKVEGQVRGLALKSELGFIFREEGRDGLHKIEQALAEAGHPLKYREIQSGTFYPLKIWGYLLLAIRNIFHYDDAKFVRIGEFDVKLSRLITIFVQHFITVDRAFKEAERMWDKYFTVGKLEVKELNKDQKYLRVVLEDFYLHPLHCLIFAGHFTGALKMIFKGGGTCEEVKCMYRGDKYHEFILRW